MAKLGVRSSYVLWGLAVALDNLVETEMAFDTNRSPDDPSTPRLHALLQPRRAAC